MTRAELKDVIANVLKDAGIEGVELAEDKKLQELNIDSLTTLEILADLELEKRFPGRISELYDTSQPWFAIVDGNVNQLGASWTLGRLLDHLENIQREHT